MLVLLHDKVVGRIDMADSFIQRLKGLTWRRTMPNDAGVLFLHCRFIHTNFMFMSIDVVFLDSSYRVVTIAKQVRPWRIVSSLQAVHTLELAAGKCDRLHLQKGDQLQFYDPALES